MSIAINNGHLAAIINSLLTDPASGEIDDQGAFENFVTDIAEVVCNYCGSEVETPARYDYQEQNNDWATHYKVQVKHGQDDAGAHAAASIWNRSFPSNNALRTFTGQVVVFASEGLVRSVALRPMKQGEVACVLIDYDDREEESPAEYEQKLLGCTREDFDLSAVYVF